MDRGALRCAATLQWALVVASSCAPRSLAFSSPGRSVRQGSHLSDRSALCPGARRQPLRGQPLRGWGAVGMQAATTDAGMEVFTRGKIEIQAVTFDLDDTLYDNLPVIKSAVAAMFAELERSHPEIEVSPDAFRAEMIGPQKEQSPDGGADLGALRHRTLAFFARKAGHARPEAVADEIMKVFMRERSRVTLFPGVLSTLAALKQRGLVLGAITNGNADMSQTPLRDALQFCVSAGELGELKPGSRPFHAALELAHSSAARTVLARM